MLQSVTGRYLVLQSVTEFYRVLQSITENYRVLQRITEYYKVLESITKTNLEHLLGPIFGLVSFAIESYIYETDVTLGLSKKKSLLVLL